jgi:hypothetical protein
VITLWIPNSLDSFDIVHLSESGLDNLFTLIGYSNVNKLLLFSDSSLTPFSGFVCFLGTSHGYLLGV